MAKGAPTREIALVSLPRNLPEPGALRHLRQPRHQRPRPGRRARCDRPYKPAAPIRCARDHDLNLTLATKPQVNTARDDQFPVRALMLNPGGQGVSPSEPTAVSGRATCSSGLPSASIPRKTSTSPPMIMTPPPIR